MTEPNQPAPSPAAESSAPQQPVPAGPSRSPDPSPPNRGGPRRPFPRGDRPRNDGTKPPPLEVRDFAASKPNKRLLDAGIEAEMEAALAGFDVSGTVAKAETRTQQQPVVTGQQQRKKGRVLGIHGKDVFVDVPGGRSQGVLPIQQFEGRTPQVGEEVEFDIERYDAANGLLVLTREGAAQVVSDWSSVANGMVVEAKVTGVNKNKTGLLVEVNGIKGFMPVSQIDMYRVEDVDQFVNQRMKCQVIELNREERNLVVSRRNLLEREREQQKEQFWATVEEGQIKTGIVRSVKPFGAFVDLGGADGLIPVSELSWSRVGDPSEVVQIGQKVEVKIHRLDFDTRKIALSLRALVKSPWDDFANSHRPGSRVTGKVTKIMEFGAFVELVPGIEGLIHVSELANLRVRRVRDVVNEGQDVTVQILNIDPENRRIALSLKAVAAEAEDAADAAAAAEEDEDKRTVEERLAARPVNPNLRGGIGRSGFQLDRGE
ncbi:MAG: S1 RNA-binding domain-containing protein [Gemmataceae bacterium]